MIDKARVQTLVKAGDLFNRDSACFVIDDSDCALTVETTLDMELQRSLLDALNPKAARSIAVVAVEPVTGRVLAMAGHERDGQSENPCLDSRFPAASVFKIVTAAAAIEEAHLNTDTELTFNGGRYTLYRSQIKEQATAHSTRIRLEDAFANSVNPIFGKLGALQLGSDTLTRWADAFGFNRSMAFEAPVAPSHFEVSSDSYRLAEIASGFNRQTTLSPLHAALIAAAAVNSGHLYEPCAVQRIVGPEGRVRYQGQPRLIGQPMTAKTASEIASMMQASVAHGTCRKPFRDQARHPVLRQLTIGGKSGSIDNQDHSARIDWFVGFATEREGSAEIAVAAVVAHEKFIGTRAGYYARHVITDHFSRLFADRKSQSVPMGRAGHPSSDRKG